VITIFSLIYGALVGALLYEFVKRRAWRWDYWVGHTNQGPVVMQIKRVCRVPFIWGFDKEKQCWRMWELHIHKMVNADMPDCFHTHPAFSWRLVIWGGYIEEYYRTARGMDLWGYPGQTPPLPDDIAAGRYTEIAKRPCRPGFFGQIRPELTHRIHALLNGKASWSLWLRGPIVADIELVGAGWGERQTRPRRAKI
jgi:hypothetical protein